MFKKKASIAVIVLAMVAVLSSGMIYAYFNDAETSNGNTFTAGTLDLKVNTVDNPTSTFTVSDVYPGATGSVAVTLTNSGTISGTLTAAIISVTNAPGATPEPEAALPTEDLGELGESMTVSIWVDLDNDGIHEAGESTLYAGTVNDASGSITMGTLAGGASTHLVITYSVPDSVGNEIQADICTFSIQYVLTQA
jgi:predicted ribosomally synthesized peptide with SipW-like signal peptide